MRQNLCRIAKKCLELRPTRPGHGRPRRRDLPPCLLGRNPLPSFLSSCMSCKRQFRHLFQTFDALATSPCSNCTNSPESTGAPHPIICPWKCRSAACRRRSIPSLANAYRYLDAIIGGFIVLLTCISYQEFGSGRALLGKYSTNEWPKLH